MASYGDARRAANRGTLSTGKHHVVTRSSSRGRTVYGTQNTGKPASPVQRRIAGNGG